MIRRFRFVFVVLAAVALLGTACKSPGSETTAGPSTTAGSSTGSQPSDKDFKLPSTVSLEMVVAGADIANLPVYVADAKGFFKARNIDFKLTNVDGSAVAVRAVSSDTADLMISLPEGPQTSMAAGAKLKIIASCINRNLYSVYGTKDIKSLSDLSGKNLGVVAAGNGTEFILKWLMDQKGGGADKATYIPVGAQPARLAALTQSQIAATVFVPPFDEQAGLAGAVKIAALTDFPEAASYPNEVISASNKAIAEKGDALKAFMLAFADAVKFINENGTESIQIGATATKGTVEQVKKEFESLKQYFPKDGAVSEAGMKWSAELLKKYSTTQNLPTLDQVYTKQFLPKV